MTLLAEIDSNVVSSFTRYLSDPFSYVPRVMLLFAFFASLLWTILKIIELLNRRPIVDFLVTREFFLRIFESGECFYLNTIVVAYNAGALIEQIKVCLKRSNGATKTFSLYVVNIGEKVMAQDLTGRYYFSSQSPIAFIPESAPQRITYICSQAEYAESVRKAYADFVNSLLALKGKYPPTEPPPDESTIKLLMSNVEEIVRNAHGKILDALQIEPGNHEITTNLYYRQRGRFLPSYRHKQATSSLKFVVEANVRDILKAQIRAYLQGVAKNILLEKSDFLRLPEYTPVKIVEQA